MPALKPQDRLVQVKTRAGAWYRLQKSGGDNSRLQHVDLSAGTYRLDESFLVANDKLTEPIEYSEYQLGNFQPDMQRVEVDAEVYARLKSYMTKLKCNSPNDVLRQLFKL